MNLTYTLRIVVPDKIDNAVMADIQTSAADHDKTLQAKIERYIGANLSDAEDDLSSGLPDGWYAAIDDVEEGD